MPIEFRSPDPIEVVDQMRGWQVPKLSDAQLEWLIRGLTEFEDSLERQRDWARNRRDHLQREVDVRASAAAEIRRREEKDRRQQETLRLRNEQLEMEHHRNTFAE